MIPIAKAELTLASQTRDAEAQPSFRQRQVAQQFEAVFLRQILKGLETSEGLAGGSSGAGVYRSMMVGALAQNISESGGIGLSEIIIKAMMPPSGEKSADLLRSATPSTATGGQVGAPKSANEGES